MPRWLACTVVLVTLAVPEAAPCAAVELELVDEAKIATLLGAAAPGRRLEASGVAALDGHYFVVFDNLEQVAVIPDEGWADPPVAARMLDDAVEAEGIVYDAGAGHWYLVEEARERLKGDKRSRINARLHELSVDETGDAMRPLGDSWLEFDLQSDNKGIEGLALARRDGRTYLLALCEGNDCDAGAPGRVPGNGRIKIFRRRGDGRDWKYVASLALPRSLDFVDYSGIDLDGDRLAVVSQESSALWVGTIGQRREGKVERWRVLGEGRVFRFPLGPDAGIVYCNVEGVAWTGADSVVVVSDKAKGDQPSACRARDQSIHRFRIPVP